MVQFGNWVGGRREVGRFQCRVFHDRRCEPGCVDWRAGPPAHECGTAEMVGMGVGDEDGGNGKPLAGQEFHDFASGIFVQPGVHEKCIPAMDENTCIGAAPQVVDAGRRRDGFH